MNRGSEGKVDVPKAKPGLSVEAYDFLLDEIVNGRLQGGEIINEAEVAEQFGTSKTPIREALRRLVTERFLRVLPRTGYMVVPVTPTDVTEILYLRQLLEGEAAFLSTARASGEDVKSIFHQLESRLEELADRVSKTEVPMADLYEENTFFHIGVADASGNSRLEAVISRLLTEDRRVLLSYERRPRVGNLSSIMVEDHMDLLSLLRSGDPERARTAMRQHVEKGRIHILSGDPGS